jgi:Zn-dependent membrane protease YugP
MAEQGEGGPGEQPVPVGPTGGPATRPKVLPWLVLHTVGRLGIFAALTIVLWMAGLDFFSGMLFGLLLSMPVAYLVLRRSRERLTEAIVARQEERRRAKDDLRSRLSGGE